MFDSTPEHRVVTTKQTRFTFDTNASDPMAEDLVKKCNLLDNRISGLINGCTLDGQPIISWILRSIPNPDPEELKKLGEALGRIADLIPAYNELSKQLEFINYAREHPNIAALAFGSFDIDPFLNEISGK